MIPQLVQKFAAFDGTRVHNSATLIPFLSQMNSVHAPIPFLKTILISFHLRPGLSTGLFPAGFPTLWRVHIVKSFIMQFSPLSCYFLRLRPKYFHQNPVLTHFQPIYLLQWVKPSFTPKQNKRQSITLYILIFLCFFFGNKLEDKRFWTKW